MERNSAQTVTLTNSIIGVGILSMPFCFQKCGIILSLVLLLLSTYITRLVCSYMIKSAIISRRKNFEQIAFYAFGFYGKLLVEICVVCYLLGTCVAYFVVVGDLGPPIMAKILSMNESSTLRSWVMIVVTVVCIVPLGLLRNVDSLATVCTASLGFYLCLVLKVMAESSEQISRTGWLDDLALWKPKGILQCLPIFSMALSCQMQLFEVYATMPTTSLDKMSRVVRQSTNFCTCIYALIGFFGYVAYNSGAQFSGNILVNFSPSFVSDIIKIGFVLSVAFSFPLAIFPCRVSLYSLLYKRAYSDTHYYIPESKFRPLTLAIVGAALCLGLMVPSIEVVIGLVGSTIGVAICIIIPAACYMHICKTNIAEKQLAQVMIALGLLIMILGTYANLEAMDHVPEKKYETAAIVEKKVTLLPVLMAEKPAENLDKSIEDLKVPLQAVPPDVKKVLTSTDNPLPKIESAQNTIKLADVGVSKPEKPSVSSEAPVEQPEPDKTKEEIIAPDAILKEEKEIAVEEKEQIQKEISELQSAKKQLEAQVQVIKEQLVKTNEETQQLVLKKFDEIVEKIDQKVSKEKEPAVPALLPTEVPPAADPKKPNESLDPKKDPIVRLLTEQSKAKPVVNASNIEPPQDTKNESSQAIDTKIAVESIGNETEVERKEPVKLIDQQQDELEKAKPLPPLPVEQQQQGAEAPKQAKSDGDPPKAAPVEKDNSNKVEDSGAKRDLLSVRNKRSPVKLDFGSDPVVEVDLAEIDKNCQKTVNSVELGEQIVQGIIDKEKFADLVRRDVMDDERKMLRK
ncbi:putative sodium-coupled neutral amino acid transporter 10 [Wyeomyia smithii]|uniref:putative sodium-coupled neutral amino acid transporter 10 n=1 Tax=Wyeomyia smithii TaxID=174621 RepID=UPI0024681091|nr:putative sodium-coupled neutral amino acid transporter 10 [Wyeomyia smithii]